MKKRILSILLVLAICLSLVSLPAAAQGFTLTQEVLSFGYSGTTLSVTAAVTNTANEESPSFNGYGAVYSSSGELKGVASLPFSLNLKANVSIAVKYEIKNYTYAEGDYTKLFLWDDNNKPLAEYASADVSIGDTIEGIVLSTYMSSPSYEEGNDLIDILITASSSFDYFEGEVITFTAGNTDAAAYLGHCVTASVGIDQNNNCTIYSISEKAGSNRLVTIDTGLINYISENTIAYYESETAKQLTEAEIQPYAFIYEEPYYFDNIVVNGFNSDYDPIGSFFEIVEYIDSITLLDNDNDGAYEFIFANIPAEDSFDFAVGAIDYDDNLWYFTDEYGDFEFAIDYNNSDMLYNIIKDGKAVDASAIAVGDTITCLDASVSVCTVYVSSLSVEGVIEEVDLSNDTYYINGAGYKISPISYDYVGELSAGDEAIFHINAFGWIAYVTVPKPDRNYYYIIDSDVSESGFSSTEYLVKAVDASGTEHVLTIQSRGVDIYYDWDYYMDIRAEEAYFILLDYISTLAMLSLNENGEISDIYLPGCDSDFVEEAHYLYDGEEQSKHFNKARCTYGVVDLSNDTIIFNIDTTDDSVTVSTVGEVFVDNESYSFIAYGKEDEICDALVTFDIDFSESDTPESDTPENEDSVSESQYAYIIDSDYEHGEFGTITYYIHCITVDGIVNYFPIKSKKVDIYTADGLVADLKAADAFEYLADYRGMVQITLTANNEISEFYLPGCDSFMAFDQYKNDAEEETAYYSASRGLYGSIIIDSSTVLYCIDTSEEDLADAITIRNAVDTLQDGCSYSIVAYGKEQEAAKALLVYDMRAYFDCEAPVMLVTRVSKAVGGNEETIKITGIQAGEDVSVIVDPDEAHDVEVEKGNVIMYTSFDGYATDVQVLFSSSDEATGELLECSDIYPDEFFDEYVTTHHGEITDKTTQTVTIGEDRFYFADEVNVSVVDYTSATTQYEVGTLSDLKTSTRYYKTAFVKTLADAADEISDIVVFIEAAE